MPEYGIPESDFSDSGIFTICVDYMDSILEIMRCIS